MITTASRVDIETYGLQRLEESMRKAYDKGFSIFLKKEKSWIDSFIHYIKPRGILIGTWGIEKELVKYVLAHELGHLMNASCIRGNYYTTGTILQSEMRAWKWTFSVLPMTSKARELAMGSLGRHIEHLPRNDE
jgi:Zn-dependent peptidase ImmA (M78 family)